jgi:PEGA domain
MSEAHDLPDTEPMRSATSALGSTSMLIAAIVLVSAVGSFGAVRAWFPRVRATPPVSANDRTAIASATRAPQAVDTQRKIDAPAAAGRLSIVTDPAHARVEIDGRPRGTSPVVIDALAAGEHRITVTSDTGVAKRTVTVSNGVMTEVVFSMSQPQPTAPLAGWVTIGSPFPIEILEHDEVVGTSGSSKIMLAAGPHQVVLRNEALGFEATRTIAVAAGRVTSVDIDPPKGLLNVNARPWADVLIDGDLVGQTPLSGVSLAVGPHQVVFRHPQLGERTERIVVTARGLNRVAVDFSK